MPTKRIEHYANGVLQSFENVTIPQRDVNLDTVYAKAQAALASNAAYLALADPSAANTTYRSAAALVANPTLVQLTAYVRLMEAQIKALSQQNNALIAQSLAATRQNNALIRLLLNSLDDVSDT